MAARTGNGATAWRRDAEILARLEIIENLVFEGYSTTRIAEQMGRTYSMTWHDLQRLATLWKERLTLQIDAHLAETLRAFEVLEHKARAAANTPGMAAPALAVALNARISQAKILGILPKKIEYAGAHGSPLFPIDSLFNLVRQARAYDATLHETPVTD